MFMKHSATPDLAWLKLPVVLKSFTFLGLIDLVLAWYSTMQLLHQSKTLPVFSLHKIKHAVNIMKGFKLIIDLGAQIN